MKNLLIAALLSLYGFINAQSFSLNWGKQYSGSSASRGGAEHVEVDNNGNVYTIGSFAGSVDFDPGPAVTNLNSVGNSVFITKMDNSGNLIWAKHFGSNTPQYGALTDNVLVVDVTGNIYCAGSFDGTLDFDPGPGLQNLNPSNDNLYLTKLDPAGNLLWAEQCGGPQAQPTMLRLDANNDLVMSGRFAGVGSDFDPGVAVLSFSANGIQDGFISKINSQGNLVWAKQITYTGTSSSGMSMCKGFAIDNTGNYFITGVFSLVCDFDPGPGTMTMSASAGRFFVCELNAQGNFVTAWQFCNTNVGTCGFPQIDNAGNIVLSGSFNGTADFDPGPGTFTMTSSGFTDVFVAKFSTSGTLIWANPLKLTGTNGWIYFTEIDAANNIYAGGHHSGTIDLDPSSGTYIYSSQAGAMEPFVVKFGSSGNFMMARKMTGPLSGELYSGKLDAGGNLYLAGNFKTGVDFDPAAGVYSLTANLIDPFVVKWNMCMPANAPVVSYSPQGICAGSIFTLSASGGSLVSWTYSLAGNQYVAFGNQYSTSLPSQGTHSFYAVASNTCAESYPPALISLTVLPQFTVGLNVNKTEFCIGDALLFTATGGTNYVYLNASFTTTISIVPGLTGIYTVTGESQDGCTNTATVQLTRNECVGLSEMKRDDQNVILFPNPGKGMFVLQGCGHATLNVMDLQGRIVFEQLLDEKNESVIDLNTLVNGVYHLSLKFQDDTKKVIKLVITD